MPLTEFTIGTSRTINLGNFESLRIEASVTTTVGPNGYASDAEHAQLQLRKLLEDTYRAQTKNKEKVA